MSLTILTSINSFFKPANRLRVSWEFQEKFENLSRSIDDGMAILESYDDLKDLFYEKREEVQELIFDTNSWHAETLVPKN